MDNYILAQACGVVGIFFGAVLANRVNDRGYRLSCMILAQMFWVFYYYYMGVSAAMLSLFVAISVSAFCFYRERLPYRDSWVWLAGFLTINALLSIYSYQGIWSIFSCLGVQLGTLSKWQMDMGKMRMFAALSICCWIGHTFFVPSPVAFVSDWTSFGFTLFAIWKFDMKKREVARVRVEG